MFALRPSLLVAGLLFTALACASSSTGSSSEASSSTGSRSTRSPDVITAAELQGVGAGNAYDIVARLRPNWLRTPTTPSQISGGVVSIPSIVVYLDEIRLGGVENLRSVTSAQIRSIRFLSATRAPTVLRDIGNDPIAGAIVVDTKD